MEQRPGTQFLERSLWRDGQVKCKLQTAQDRQEHTYRAEYLSPIPCAMQPCSNLERLHCTPSKPKSNSETPCAVSLAPPATNLSGGFGRYCFGAAISHSTTLSVNIGHLHAPAKHGLSFRESKYMIQVKLYTNTVGIIVFGSLLKQFVSLHRCETCDDCARVSTEQYST